MPTSNIPPTKAAAFAPQFLQALPYMRLWDKALTVNHIAPPSPSPQSSLFNELIGNAIDEVTFKKKTPTQALAAVDQKVSAAVQQFKQFHPTWPTE